MSYQIDIAEQKVQTINMWDILSTNDIFSWKKPSRIIVTMLPIYEDEIDVDFRPVERVSDILEKESKSVLKKDIKSFSSISSN